MHAVALVGDDAGAVPTYDYQCRDCGNVIEVIHAMSADGPAVCELCGGNLRRVIHAAGIIFKGSGFYRTDSRRESGSTSASTASSTSNGGESGGGTSSGSDLGGSAGDGGKPKASPSTDGAPSPAKKTESSGSSD